MYRSSIISIISGVFVFLAIAFAVKIRFIPHDAFSEGHMPDPDNYRIVRQANQIVSFGRLPSRDAQRWAPLGFDNSIQTTLTPYLLATIYRISRLIGFEASLESVAMDAAYAASVDSIRRDTRIRRNSGNCFQSTCNP